MSDTDAQTARPPWINHYFAIIPRTITDHAPAPALLMLPSQRGWHLPYARGEGLWVAYTTEIIDLLRAQLDLDFDFTILRHIGFEANAQARWDRTLLVLEPRHPLQEAPGAGQWIDAATLSTLPLAQPDQCAPLLAYLAEQAAPRTEVEPQRAPWARPGWFATASAWMTTAITELGHTLTGPVEQLRNWSISSLLVAPTTAGRVFFKAAAALPLFVNEPALTQTLAHYFPAHIPTPLKIDRERGWMLMEDFGTHTWDNNSDADSDADDIDLAPMLVAYGKLQRASVHHLDALRDAGCIDRRLDVLAGQIDALIADPTTRAVLTAAEHAELTALAPTLKARCAAVAAYNLPATLIHGDLHLGNVTLRDGEYLFYDWTDAAISLPFVDFFQLYFEHEPSEETARWRDAYLALWTEYATPARLLEAWDLAKPLCALHHAISYLTIVNHIEPLTRAELIHGLPDNLHRLLACFRKDEQT